MSQERELTDVSHTSKRGSSLRITVPWKVVERLGLEPDQVVRFYNDGGKVVVGGSNIIFNWITT